MGKSSECIGGEFLMADNVNPILMADYLVTNMELTAVADAIRDKAGTAGQLSFPDGFVSAIQGIQAESTLQEKVVTPTTSQQDITPDSGYDGLSKVTIAAMPTAEQATPNITVSSSGLITATSEQSEGYVALGTKSSTQQLTTQAAKTVTPGTADQTAVSSGRYTTGAVIVKGDANLVAGNIKSGVSIFGVAGTYDNSLEVSSKALNFSSLRPDSSHTVSVNGYITISVGSTIIGSTPNLIYVEGIISDTYKVSATRIDNERFNASVYRSSAQGFVYEDIVFGEGANSGGGRYWEWMIDPEGIKVNSTVKINTIVMGE